MTQQEAWVALNGVSGLGTVRINALLAYFGDAESVFKASRDELTSLGILPQGVISNIIAFAKDKFIEREYGLMRQKGVSILTLDDEDYPKTLRTIPGAPLVLYVLGDAKVLSNISLGVVGSRIASFYGQRVAGDFANAFGQAGINVVSGLARGIDTAAHRGCLKAKHPTVAVIGCGLNFVYPKENEALYKEIVNNGGAIISELPMDISPAPRNFPPRNRIISGLAQAVVIIEAAEKSGALITVDYALEQGREVFAVPGPVDHISSKGSNQLIKDGVKVALTPHDVLELLGVELTKEQQALEVGVGKVILSQDEFRGFQLMSRQPVHIEQLMAQLGWGLPQAREVLLNLELKQTIRQLPGEYYVKV